MENDISISSTVPKDFLEIPNDITGNLEQSVTKLGPDYFPCMQLDLHYRLHLSLIGNA